MCILIFINPIGNKGSELNSPCAQKKSLESDIRPINI